MNQYIYAAAYLLNRSPVKKLNWKTPYELIMKEKPDISHIVLPFYSKRYYHLTKEERTNTLSQKAKE